VSTRKKFCKFQSGWFLVAKSGCKAVLLRISISVWLPNNLLRVNPRALFFSSGFDDIGKKTTALSQRRARVFVAVLSSLRSFFRSLVPPCHHHGLFPVSWCRLVTIAAFFPFFGATLSPCALFTRPLHGFGHDSGQIGLAHAGICRLGLFNGALKDIGAHRLLNESRKVAFATTALRCKEHANGLIRVRRYGDIPAHGAHDVL
jgi:hypothetical protein